MIYQCVTCLVPFVRKDVSDDAVRYASASIDLVGAVLWDFHERALAKYGVPVMDQDEVEERTDCAAEGKEHEWELGTCTRCGVSLYLGG